MKSSGPHLLAHAAEDFSIVLTYAHSRQSLNERRETAHGEWKHLDRLLYFIPEFRADRALLEMAVLLRSLDDMENISGHLGNSFGKLKFRNGNEADMTIRDVANKIIHAVRYEWRIDDPTALMIRCIGEPGEKWEFADISIDDLAFGFGQMAV